MQTHGWMQLDEPWEISSESSEEQADLVEEVAVEEAPKGRTPFPGERRLAMHSASKKRDRPLSLDSRFHDKMRATPLSKLCGTGSDSG